ncbi:TolB family protein [candidate division KSB1 bacterium]
MLNQLVMKTSQIIVFSLLLFIACSDPSGPLSEYYYKDRIAFSSDMDGDFDIYTVKRDGTKLERLTDCSKQGYDMASKPCWSYDGKRIAFLMMELYKGNAIATAVYSINSDGAGLNAIIKSLFVGTIIWDGDYNLFTFVVWGGFDSAISGIYITDINIRLTEQLLSVKNIRGLDRNRSGELIYASGLDIYYRQNVYDQEPVLLVQGAYPKWSPEGDRVTYVFDEQIWTMNSDGTAQELIIDSGEYPDWTPDDNGIIYNYRNNGEYSIYYYDFASGETTPIVANGHINIRPICSPL